MTSEELNKFKRTLVGNRCWKGYKPVKGKRPYSKGSCRKVRRNPSLSFSDFRAFLSETLIPDLRESGQDATADDFETAVEYLTHGKDRKYSAWRKFIVGRLVPDLRASDYKATAKDFMTAIKFIDAGRRVVKNPASLKKLKFAPFKPIKMLERAGDADEAQKLFIYFENDSNLMMRRYPQFELNLDRKVKRGIFDRTKALKLFLYLANEIAKDYAKFFKNQSGFSAPVASVSTRKLLASLLLEKYEGDRYPINKNSARLQNNGVRKKTWKIGEYAVGGIIEAMVNSEGNIVGIRNAEYKTGDTISKQLFRWPLDKSRLEMHLNDLTTSYYADKIIQWLMAGSWELRSNPAELSDAKLQRAYKILNRDSRLREMLKEYDVDLGFPHPLHIRSDPSSMKILTQISKFFDSGYHARKLMVDNLQKALDKYLDETEEFLEANRRSQNRDLPRVTLVRG